MSVSSNVNGMDYVMYRSGQGAGIVYSEFSRDLTAVMGGVGGAAVGGLSLAAEEAEAELASIETPYGEAIQGDSSAALSARTQVENNALLYRTGTVGKSQTSEAQFWALEHPMSEGYASRYGIPEENVINSDFIEAGRLNSGSNFITREAPGIGNNVGGGIEVVVPEKSVSMQWFNSI